MANARKKIAKQQSLEVLQKQRTSLYFSMGDKSYHIKALEADIFNITNQISQINETISGVMKQKERETASQKMEDSAAPVANA